MATQEDGAGGEASSAESPSERTFRAEKTIDGLDTPTTMPRCGVCAESPKYGTLTACGHVLCSECWPIWFAKETVCPECRRLLQGAERGDFVAEKKRTETDQVRRLLSLLGDRWERILDDKFKLKGRVVDLESENMRLRASLEESKAENLQLLHKLRYALTGSPMPVGGSAAKSSYASVLASSSMSGQLSSASSTIAAANGNGKHASGTLESASRQTSGAALPPKPPAHPILKESGALVSAASCPVDSVTDMRAAVAAAMSGRSSLPGPLYSTISSGTGCWMEAGGAGEVPPEWVCVRTFDTHAEPIHGIATHPTINHIVATASWDHTCKVYNLHEDKLMCTLQGHSQGLYAVKFAHTARSLVGTASSDQTCRLWDISTGECLRILSGHSDEVNGLAFDRKSHVVATASDDKSGIIWDLESGSQIVKFEGHTAPMYGICFSPVDQLVASVSFDRTVKLWDPRSRDAVRTLIGQHTDDIIGVDLDISGRFLATGSDDRTCRIWDTSTWQPVATLTSHQGEVKRVRFSPEGSRLATTSGDATVKIFSLSDLSCLATLRGHTDHVFDAAWALDSSFLVSGCHDNTWRLWKQDKQGGSSRRDSTSGPVSSAAPIEAAPPAAVLTQRVDSTYYRPTVSEVVNPGFGDGARVETSTPSTLEPTAS